MDRRCFARRPGGRLRDTCPLLVCRPLVATFEGEPRHSLHDQQGVTEIDPPPRFR